MSKLLKSTSNNASVPTRDAGVVRSAATLIVLTIAHVNPEKENTL